MNKIFTFEDGRELMCLEGKAYIVNGEDEQVSVPVGFQVIHPLKPSRCYIVVETEECNSVWQELLHVEIAA